MVETIEGREQPLALVIRPEGEDRAGTQFVTESSNPLQVGVIRRDSGDAIPAHSHKEFTAAYSGIRQEFIIVSQGRLTVNIYDTDGAHVASVPLGTGDALLQLAGGHGFEFEEKTRLLEVKQGPYMGKQQDKAIHG